MRHPGLYPRGAAPETYLDITHPDDLAASYESFTPLLRGDWANCVLAKRYVRKDSSPLWAESFASLQRDAAGAPAYVIAVIRDLSERKRLQSELRQAKEEAEATNRTKDEFLANVSHEIGTPMNAILGMTELVLDTPLTEDQRQCLQRCGGPKRAKRVSIYDQGGRLWPGTICWMSPNRYCTSSPRVP